jgi:hypothetical protein
MSECPTRRNRCLDPYGLVRPLFANAAESPSRLRRWIARVVLAAAKDCAGAYGDNGRIVRIACRPSRRRTDTDGREAGMSAVASSDPQLTSTQTLARSLIGQCASVPARDVQSGSR